MWRRHPLHLIVGLDLIVTGLILLTHHHYFFWPPQPVIITAVLNDAIVGIVGMATGIGMIIWACSKVKSVKADHWLITIATGYYTILSMTELAHALFAPAGEPHMITSGISELVLALVTLYMASLSDSKEEDDESRG